jgi:glycosyltransferase involved in cell wall biosynthesis
MKKLAIVATHPVPYNVPWLMQLAGKGVAIRVFYTYEQAGSGPFYDKGFGEEIEWDIPLLTGYEYEFVPNRSWVPGLEHFLGIVNPGLNSRIEAWQPDGVLVIGWGYYSHLKCLRHFHGRIPVYFKGDSVLLKKRSGLRHHFLSWVYTHVDHAFYAGSHNRRYFVRHGLLPRQLIFSPKSIDLDRFAGPDAVYNAQARRWKQELGIPVDHLTVLFAGKLTKVKNPWFVIRLAAACRHLPITFIIAGNGPLRRQLVRLAGDATNIRFVGFQKQSVMPVVYRMGDIYLMPSLSETWGVGVNEAMACGIPVMVSDQVGCAADLVLENKTGITFGLDDRAKCVGFLERVVKRPVLLADMGTYARALIEFFSYSQTADSVARVFCETPARQSAA